MRLGIIGGTFNPIHWGHLVLAETARETLALDRVVFIPTRHPPHKRASNLLPGSVRFALVQLAIHDHPNFVASDIELQREGSSYSIDTVRILHQQLPQAKLFLLMGADMLSVRWIAWDELKRLCTVVVAHRPLDSSPGFSRPSARASGFLAEGSRAKAREGALPGSRPVRREVGLKWLAMPQVEISSTDIRLRLRAGRSIRYLVPPAVERYIREHRLYGKGQQGAER